MGTMAETKGCFQFGTASRRATDGMMSRAGTAAVWNDDAFN